MLSNFFTPRLTELGKIKIGGKGAERTSAKGTKYRQPEKHDYFTITTMNRTPAGDLIEDGELMQQLVAEYGSGDPPALRELPIRLLSDDIEDVMQSAYVWYGGKTIGGRGDGKKVTWFNDPANGTRLPEPKEEPWDDKFLELKDSRSAKLFKLHTTFNCVIAAKEARWGGVYKFRTTSIISGSQLYGSLIETLRLTGGVLVGMPLMLVVRPIIVTPDGKPITVYVVHVELRGAEMKAIQERALTQMRYAVEFKGEMEQAKAQYRKMLAAPGEHESPSEARDIAEEFHPEIAELDAKAAPTDADPLIAESPQPEPSKETAREPERSAEVPVASTTPAAPAPATSPDAVLPIDEPHKAALIAAFRAKRYTRKGVRKKLEPYSVDTIDKLTEPQAEELLKALGPVAADAPPPKPATRTCPPCGSENVGQKGLDWFCKDCGATWEEA